MIENSLSMLAGHNIWQSVAIFLIVGVIFKTIKANSAEERSWSWTATLFGLALLPLATFMPGEGIATTFFKAQNEVTKIEALTSQTAVNYQPFNAILQDPPTIIQAPQTNIMPWLLLLWGAGTAFSLILLSRASYNAYRLRINATPYQNVPANWPKNLDISISDEIKTPMVIGIIKPLVLIPTKFVNEMEPNLLNPLLFHELAHIKRHDNILYFMERLILTFYWWNPLMHVIAKRISEEREHACDDRAALSCGDQVVYAKSLLMGAKNIIGREQAVLGLAAYRIKSPLGKRIMRLTDASAFAALNLKSLVRNITILLIAIISLGLVTPRFVVEGANALAQEVEEIDKFEISKEALTDIDSEQIEADVKEAFKDIQSEEEIAQITKYVEKSFEEAEVEINVEQIKEDVREALKDFPSDEEVAQIKMDIEIALKDLPSMIDDIEIIATVDDAIKTALSEVDIEKIQTEVKEALANIEIDKEKIKIEIEQALKDMPTKEEMTKIKIEVKENLAKLKADRKELKQKQKNKEMQ